MSYISRAPLFTRSTSNPINVNKVALGESRTPQFIVNIRHGEIHGPILLTGISYAVIQCCYPLGKIPKRLMRQREWVQEFALQYNAFIKTDFEVIFYITKTRGHTTVLISAILHIDITHFKHLFPANTWIEHIDKSVTDIIGSRVRWPVIPLPTKLHQSKWRCSIHNPWSKSLNQITSLDPGICGSNFLSGIFIYTLQIDNGNDNGNHKETVWLPWKHIISMEYSGTIPFM